MPSASGGRGFQGHPIFPLWDVLHSQPTPTEPLVKGKKLRGGVEGTRGWSKMGSKDQTWHRKEGSSIILTPALPWDGLKVEVREANRVRLREGAKSCPKPCPGHLGPHRVYCLMLREANRSNAIDTHSQDGDEGVDEGQPVGKEGPGGRAQRFSTGPGGVSDQTAIQRGFTFQKRPAPPRSLPKRPGEIQSYYE